MTSALALARDLRPCAIVSEPVVFGVPAPVILAAIARILGDDLPP